jgi:hypothetical protein
MSNVVNQSLSLSNHFSLARRRLRVRNKNKSGASSPPLLRLRGGTLVAQDDS